MKKNGREAITIICTIITLLFGSGIVWTIIDRSENSTIIEPKNTVVEKTDNSSDQTRGEIITAIESATIDGDSEAKEVETNKPNTPTSYMELDVRNRSGDHYETSVSVYSGEDIIMDANAEEHSGKYLKLWFFTALGSNTCQMTSYTNKQYLHFRGTYFLSRESEGKATFRIYGDEIELYNSGIINRKTPAASFDIDITGIIELQVVVSGSGGDNNVLYIFEPEVY